tara:strand:- start:659103 stop:659468 length:366 start_codon:yes stop_codon:yes gene_type:complete
MLKLSELLNSFRNASDKKEEDLDLISIAIETLEQHNWDPDLSAISLMICAGGTELNDAQNQVLLELIKEKAHSQSPRVKLNDYQKIDTLVKCLERGNPDQIDLNYIRDWQIRNSQQVRVLG